MDDREGSRGVQRVLFLMLGLATFASAASFLAHVRGSDKRLVLALLGIVLVASVAGNVVQFIDNRAVARDVQFSKATAAGVAASAFGSQ